MIETQKSRTWPFIKSGLLMNAEELRKWAFIKSWLLIKWEIQRYQEPALDKYRGIEKMAIYQELALIKMENPCFIKSQLLINGEKRMARQRRGRRTCGAVFFAF